MGEISTMSESVVDLTVGGGIGVLIVAAITGLWRLASWQGYVNSDRDTFKTFMGKIDNTLEDIQSEIKRIFSKMPSDTIASNSPVMLTDAGQKVSEAAKAPAWAEPHVMPLTGVAKGKEEFEVYDVCMEYVDNEYRGNPEFERSVRAISYEHWISDIDMLKMYSVVLRDAVLASLRNQTEPS